MEHTQIFLKYWIQLEQICQEKQYNQVIKNMLKKWYLWIFTSYNPDLNLINYASLDNYLENQLSDLRKLRKFVIYDIEEILKDSTNPFHWYIKPLAKNENFKYLFLCEKKGDIFYLKKDGNFFLSSYGLTSFEKLSIALVNYENNYKTFHHELRHINQGTNKYFYPSIYPFFEEVQKMCQEGEAVFHRRLIDGNIKQKKNDWTEEEIREYSYDLFYQMYMLLLFSLPEKFQLKWEKGIFDVSDIPKEKYNFFIVIFSILTILTAKTEEKNTNEKIIGTANFCYQNCLRKWIKCSEKIAEEKKNENQKKLYEKAIQENKYILLHTELLEKKYMQDIEKNIEKITMDDFKKSLEDWNYYYSYRKKYFEKKQEEKEIENLREKYKFGINISVSIKNFIEENLTITELFQLVVSEIENYLQEIKVRHLEDKLLFIKDLKMPKNGHYNKS